MKKALFFPLQVSLCTVGYLYASGSIIQAQVVPDGTTSTTVNSDNNGNFTIEQGDRAGNNLFHSFGDFSVPTDGSAFFNNATDISNIFSRVTGGNISNIDGLIRANGGANLFLINPAGILFGNNARLDIGGSFYGSSASSILFEDGEFSAVDNLEQPVLTVNAPIGLGFRDSPGEIVNRSFAQNSADEFVGLEVLSGQTLALIGGDVIFEAGEATARGGNIEIGGLAEAGTVSFNTNGSLDFPDDIARANLLFENAADLDVRGTGGGNITVNANNLQLTDGEFGGSLIRAGITSDSTSADAQAGDILVNATGGIILSNIRILNQVDLGGVGNSGNITINTGFLEVINGGDISASTFGRGNAGLVDIIATENINLDGEDLSGFPSGVTSFVGQEAEGDAGGINIATGNLSLTNGGQINASAFGTGNGGNITINTSDSIFIDGDSADGFGSGIFAQIFPGGIGNAGEINITTSNLVLTNGSSIAASTFGEGDAGTINIQASESINVDGASENEDFNISTTIFSQESSAILSQVGTDAIGNAGNINIRGTNISLTNGGQVSASTFGQGDAGSININANKIDINGASLDFSSSVVTSSVELDAEGNAGDIDITTSNLVLSNGGIIFAGTVGSGDAGDISITSDFISIDGDSANGLRSGIFSVVSSGSEGNAGGDIDITTSNLVLTNGSAIDASTFGLGNGGNIEVKSNNINLLDNAEINANSDGDGIAGSIFIQATDLELDNSFISATSRSANSFVSAGNTDLQIEDLLSLVNNSSISTEAFDNANAGNINIDAGFILGRQNLIQTLFSAAEQGFSGNITITASFILGLNLDNLDGGSSISFVDITNQPKDLVESKQTFAQACPARRQTISQISSLVVKGKGGIPREPGLMLDSHNISINDETNPTSNTPQAIETSQGEIQPARGIKVTEDGGIILTAYRTNNSGDRIPHNSQNCS